MQPDERVNALAGLIQEHLRKCAKGDFFHFKFEDAFPITDLRPGHACARVNFTVMVGKSEMLFLRVDVAGDEYDATNRQCRSSSTFVITVLSSPVAANRTVEFIENQYPI